MKYLLYSLFLFFVLICFLNSGVIWACNTMVETTHASCSTSTDGAVILTVTPSGTYTFDWSPNVSTSNTASELATGDYTVTVSGEGGGGQVVLFNDTFNNGAPNWLLNTSVGSNQWFVDAIYVGAACTFLATPLFVVPDVPNQPTAVAGSPQSPYLHISATNPGGGLCDSPWPPGNANFDGGQASDQCAEMVTGISTVGYTNVEISFYWLCAGGTSSLGQIQYSANGGGWTAIGGNFVK